MNETFNLDIKNYLIIHVTKDTYLETIKASNEVINKIIKEYPEIVIFVIRIYEDSSYLWYFNVFQSKDYLDSKDIVEHVISEIDPNEIIQKSVDIKLFFEHLDKFGKNITEIKKVLNNK